MKSRWPIRIGKMLSALVAGTVVLSMVVMLLWNALVPELLKGPVITFWQALGVLVLSHILFRGWAPWRRTNGWRHDRWRHRFEEKLAAMTPEDREKFREEWRRRCGHSPESTEGAASTSATK